MQGRFQCWINCPRNKRWQLTAQTRSHYLYCQNKRKGRKVTKTITMYNILNKNKGQRRHLRCMWNGMDSMALQTSNVEKAKPILSSRCTVLHLLPDGNKSLSAPTFSDIQLPRFPNLIFKISSSSFGEKKILFKNCIPAYFKMTLQWTVVCSSFV